MNPGICKTDAIIETQMKIMNTDFTSIEIYHQWERNNIILDEIREKELQIYMLELQIANIGIPYHYQ